jgi:hypothetical protein
LLDFHGNYFPKDSPRPGVVSPQNKLVLAMHRKRRMDNSIRGYRVDATNREIVLPGGYVIHLPTHLTGILLTFPNEHNIFNVNDTIAFDLQYNFAVKVVRDGFKAESPGRMKTTILDMLVPEINRKGRTRLNEDERSFLYNHLKPLMATMMKEHFIAELHDGMYDADIVSSWSKHLERRFSGTDVSNASCFHPQISIMWSVVQHHYREKRDVPQHNPILKYTDMVDVAKYFKTSKSIYISYDVRQIHPDFGESPARSYRSSLQSLRTNNMLRELITIFFTDSSLFELDGLPKTDAALGNADLDDVYVYVGRMILKAWLEKITIRTSLSDVVYRIITLPELPTGIKDGNSKDIDKLYELLVPDPCDYAKTIGALLSRQNPDGNPLIDLCESVAAGDCAPSQIKDFLWEVVGKRICTLCDLRKGVRSTYSFGLYMDMFGIETLRLMLEYVDTFTVEQLCQKFTVGGEHADAFKHFGDALECMDGTHLGQVCFYLFREYDFKQFRKIKILFDDYSDELVNLWFLQTCTSQLKINTRIADTLKAEEYCARILDLCQNHHYDSL